jgi:hypothetical protein
VTLPAPAPAAPAFTPKEIRDASRWLDQFAADWKGEIPLRIHDQGHGQHFGLGSAPPFAPEFVGYIGRLACKDPTCQECRNRDKRVNQPVDYEGYRSNGNERTRTTRVFRKLRRVAPLEFDVLYMIVMHGLSLPDIAKRLNVRAFERGFADRYDVQTVAILALAGIDKASKWW